jgi:hypothetical protein
MGSMMVSMSVRIIVSIMVSILKQSRGILGSNHSPKKHVLSVLTGPVSLWLSPDGSKKVGNPVPYK